MFLHALKKTFICISYMAGLNDAGSFLVAYSNYETVQKNVERRLSQQMVRNDSIFVTIFDCFGPLFKLPLALERSGSKMKLKQTSTRGNKVEAVQKNCCALRSNFLTLTLFRSL